MHHLSRLTAIVKQLALADLNEEQREFLDACFPEFAREEDRLEPLKALGIRQVISNRPRPVAYGRLRRFSGGPTLGRSRYWTLCHNETGEDGNTLLCELMAYWNPSTGLLPELRDARHLAETSDGRKRPQRVLEIKAELFRAGGLFRRRIVRDRQLDLRFPLTVRRLDIDDVVDLRFPETQRWFFEHFVALEEQIGLRGDGAKGALVDAATYKFRKLRGFADLLPTLVMPARGGASFHEAVGAWLRSNGASALVFPSARRDAMMKRDSAGRRCVFDGWNLVDYRDAGPCEWDMLFGRFPSWPRAEQAGIRIESYPGDDATGWAVKGAEEREMARYRAYRRTLKED